VAVNPVRTCIGCGQTDDHPRHVIVVGEVDVPWHIDCHVLAAGCAICRHLLDGVGGVDGNPKGDMLRDHLDALPPLEVEHVENDDPADPHNLTSAVITAQEA